jgi:hypothetical protein
MYPRAQALSPSCPPVSSQPNPTHSTLWLASHKKSCFATWLRSCPSPGLTPQGGPYIAHNTPDPCCGGVLHLIMGCGYLIEPASPACKLQPPCRHHAHHLPCQYAHKNLAGASLLRPCLAVGPFGVTSAAGFLATQHRHCVTAWRVGWVWVG